MEFADGIVAFPVLALSHPPPLPPCYFLFQRLQSETEVEANPLFCVEEARPSCLSTRTEDLTPDLEPSQPPTSKGYRRTPSQPATSEVDHAPTAHYL